MGSRITNRAFLASLALFFTICYGNAQFPTQKPQGYVSDLADVLSPEARQQLEALCTELDQKTRAQLAIVTVKSLEGRALEEFTVDLATKWGIGRKRQRPGRNASRIEVGYGLESIVTLISAAKDGSGA